jgi:hypothetical protein
MAVLFVKAATVNVAVYNTYPESGIHYKCRVQTTFTISTKCSDCYYQVKKSNNYQERFHQLSYL